MNEIKRIDFAKAKQWPSKPKGLKPTDNNVRVIKTKFEVIIENESYDVESYITWVEYHLAGWVLSLNKEEKYWFRQCLKFIWRLMIDIENNKDYYLKLLEQDKEKLSEIERYYFAFIIFLFKTTTYDDDLNIDNFKYIIERMIKKSPDIELYKYLKRFNRRILETTEILIRDNPDMFDYKYLLNPLNKLLPKDDEEYKDDEWEDETLPPNAE